MTSPANELEADEMQPVLPDFTCGDWKITTQLEVFT
jgi:hypothetical protein